MLTRKRREEFFSQRSNLASNYSLMPRAGSPLGGNSSGGGGMTQKGSSSILNHTSSSVNPTYRPTLPQVSIVTELASSSEDDSSRGFVLASSDARRLRTAQALASPGYSRRLMLRPSPDDVVLPLASSPVAAAKMPATLAVPSSTSLGGSNSSLSSGYCAGSSRSGTCSPVSPLSTSTSWQVMAESPPMMASRDLSPALSPPRRPEADNKSSSAFRPFPASHISTEASDAKNLPSIWIRRVDFENFDAAHETDIMF